jgi:hypothetical protein
MYILEAIAATRLRDILSLNLCMNPSTIPPKNFPCGAFDETIQTKRNIYNLDATPKVRRTTQGGKMWRAKKKR